MRVSSRAIATFCVILSTALVVGAAGGGLYTYSDDELAGPEQPLEFSHAVHSTLLGMDCLYCHSAAPKSQHATIPAVSVCIGCHQWVKKGTSEGSVEAIAKLQDYYDRGEPIPWLRIHNLPEHVQFKHSRHVNAKLECQACHGPVETMNRVWLVPDTVLRPSSGYLPAAKLEMGWCMNCHLEQKAADDCAACHY
jgi:hypothetical protein